MVMDADTAVGWTVVALFVAALAWTARLVLRAAAEDRATRDRLLVGRMRADTAPVDLDGQAEYADAAEDAAIMRAVVEMRADLAGFDEREWEQRWVG